MELEIKISGIEVEIDVLTDRLVGMSNPMKVRRTKKRIKNLTELLKKLNHEQESN